MRKILILLLIIITSIFPITTLASEESLSLNDVMFCNGLFVAVGEAGTIKTSKDSSSWKTSAKVTKVALNTITFSGSRYYIAGNSGTILSSKDGNSWIPMKLPIKSDITCISWCPEKKELYAGAKDGYFLLCKDEKTWKAYKTLPKYIYSSNYQKNIELDKMKKQYFVPKFVSGNGSEVILVDCWGKAYISHSGKPWQEVEVSPCQFNSIEWLVEYSSSISSLNWNRESKSFIISGYTQYTFRPGTGGAMFISTFKPASSITPSFNCEATYNTPEEAYGGNPAVAFYYEKSRCLSIFNLTNYNKVFSGNSFTDMKEAGVFLGCDVKKITYGNNTFVAVGSNNGLYISKDTVASWDKAK